MALEEVGMSEKGKKKKRKRKKREKKVECIQRICHLCREINWKGKLIRLNEIHDPFPSLF